jgi:hypothetical protein
LNEVYEQRNRSGIKMLIRLWRFFWNSAGNFDAFLRAERNFPGTVKHWWLIKLSLFVWQKSCRCLGFCGFVKRKNSGKLPIPIKILNELKYLAATQQWEAEKYRQLKTKDEQGVSSHRKRFGCCFYGCCDDIRRTRAITGFECSFRVIHKLKILLIQHESN